MERKKKCGRHWKNSNAVSLIWTWSQNIIIFLHEVCGKMPKQNHTHVMKSSFELDALLCFHRFSAVRKKSEFLSPSPRRKITSFCFCLCGKTDVGRKKTLFFSSAFLAGGILLHTLLAWFEETGSRWHEWPSIIPMKLFFAFSDFFRGKASWAATKRRLRRRMRRRTKPGGASRQVRIFFFFEKEKKIFHA